MDNFPVYNSYMPVSAPIKDKKQLGLVFGVFDGLHKGHKHFLNDALEHCGKLVVILARSSTVVVLKGHKPRFSFMERAEALRVFDSRTSVLPGDKKPGKWKVLRDIGFNPDTHTVILGYDQKDIAVELQKMSVKFITLSSFKPEKYKSSYLP